MENCQSFQAAANKRVPKWLPAPASHVGRQILDDRARSWSRRSPRTFRDGTLAGATIREAGARTENDRFTAGALIAAFRRAPPAWCGAFADDWRVVARRRRRPSVDAKPSSRPSGSAARAVQCPRAATRAAIPCRRQVIAERARHRSRRSPRALPCGTARTRQGSRRSIRFASHARKVPSPLPKRTPILPSLVIRSEFRLRWYRATAAGRLLSPM